MQFIQNKIKQVIVEQASTYFKDFDDAENLSIAASKGDITLKDLQLKENAIDLGDQPFKIVRGKFSVIDVNIPFNMLFSQPCTIDISGVDLLVELKGSKDVNISKEDYYDYLKNSFISFTKELYTTSMGGKTGGGFTDFWMIKNAIERIFDNLQISLKMVNIRILDKSFNAMSMNIHLGKFEIKTTDSSFAKQIYVRRSDLNEKSPIIFKKIDFKDFVVRLDDLHELGLTKDPKKQLFGLKSYKYSRDNDLFRFGFEIFMKIRTRPQPTEAQYDCFINIMKYILQIQEWQVQKILVLLENMKTFATMVKLARDRFSFRPEKTIREVSLALMEEPNPQIAKKKKSVIVNRWFKYAVLGVMKQNMMLKKRKRSQEFRGLIDNNTLDRIFKFKLPETVTDIYQDAIHDVLEELIDNNFDVKKVEEGSASDLKILNFRNLMFTLNDHEKKTMARRAMKKIANKRLLLINNNWISWAKSYLPFGLGKSQTQRDIEEVENMIKDQIGKGHSKSFNKYLLTLVLDISQINISLMGGSSIQSIEYKGQMKNIKIKFDSFDSSQRAKVKLNSLKFIYIKKINDPAYPSPGSASNMKQLASSVNMGNYSSRSGKKGGSGPIVVDIIKSTVPENSDFMQIEYLSTTEKMRTMTNIDIKIEHLDFFFLKNVMGDLQSFFRVEANDELREIALAEFTKFSKKSRIRVKENLRNYTSTTIISARIKSPRVVIPLVESSYTLDENTNLFVLYLGDVNFKNIIKPGSMLSNNSYTAELLNFKLEFWEDYGDAVKALNYASDEFIVLNTNKYDKPKPNFIVLDFSAFVELLMKSNSSMSLNFISDNFDFRINNHLFHNIMLIPPLLRFEALQEARVVLEDKKRHVVDAMVAHAKFAVKYSLDQKYSYKYGILSKKTLYFYNNVEDLKPISKIYLPYSNMNYFIEKSGAHILKINKAASSPYLLAFPSREKLAYWANVIKSAVPSVRVAKTNPIKREGLNDGLSEKKSQSYTYDFEVVIRKCSLSLYDEVYSKIFTAKIENIDSKIKSGDLTRVKLSFCSLLIQNFDKNFESRDIDNLLFIGTSQAPKPEKRDEEDSRHSSRLHHPGYHHYEESTDQMSKMTDSEANLTRFTDQIRNGHNGNTNHHLETDSRISFHPDEVRSNKSFKSNQISQMTPQNKNHPIHHETIYQGPLTTSRKSRQARRSSPIKNNNYIQKFDQQTVMTTINQVKATEKSALIYYESSKDLTDINLKLVNLNLIFDADYFHEITKAFEKFEMSKYFGGDKKGSEGSTGSSDGATDQEEKPKGWYKTPEIQPHPEIDSVYQKVRVDFGRMTIVCRTKSRNLFDLILMKGKIIIHESITKRMINVFMKRFALRDLTNYPLTREVHELQDYANQPKHVLVSFRETPNAKKAKGASDGLGEAAGETDRSRGGVNGKGKPKQDRSKLNKYDSYGLVGFVSLTRGEYKNPQNVGTEAEMFLNNGEFNYFLQPIFRFLDFIFNVAMPMFTIDDSLIAPDSEIELRLRNPGKNLYNVFVKNLKMNMRPNFEVKQFPMYHFGEMIVVNGFEEHPERVKSSRCPYPIFSEVINVNIKDAVMKSHDRKVNMLSHSEFKVDFKKMICNNLLERMLTRKGMFEMIDPNNHIKMYIRDFEINWRRDDFYSLMNFIFCNAAFNDEKDDELKVKPNDKEGPFFGMTVQMLMDGYCQNFLANDLQTFFDLKFDQFLVDLRKDNWNSQVINIYGEQIDSNGYHYEVTDLGSTVKKIYPFIKTMKNIDQMTNIEKEKVKKFDFDNNSRFFHKEKGVGFNEVDKKIDEQIRYYEDPDNMPEFHSLIEMSPKGDKVITNTLKKLGIAYLLPLINKAREVAGTTWEMGMNTLIQPPLKRGQSGTYVTMNMFNCFVFLLPPKGMDYNMVLNTPEMSMVYSRDWMDLKDSDKEIHLHFSKEEFEDEEYKNFNKNQSIKTPIGHLAAMLCETSMHLVESQDIHDWCTQVTAQGGDHQLVSRDLDFRMVMSPIDQIGYHVQTNALVDKFKEINFNRGVARIGETLLMLTTYDIHYLMKWSESSKFPYWETMDLSSPFEKMIKGIVKEQAPANWIGHIKKTNKSKLDIVYGGMKAFLLDDIYDTNIEFFRMKLHPISTTQLSGYKKNGFDHIFCKLEAEFYNYQSKAWEPIVENFSFVVDKSSNETEGSTTFMRFTDKSACVNISTEMIVIAQAVMKQRQLRNDVEDERMHDDDEEMKKRRLVKDALRRLIKSVNDDEYDMITNVYSPELNMSTSAQMIPMINERNTFNLGSSGFGGRGGGAPKRTHLEVSKLSQINKSITEQGPLYLSRNPLEFEFSKHGKRDQFDNFSDRESQKSLVSNVAEGDMSLIVHQVAEAMRGLVGDQRLSNGTHNSLGLSMSGSRTNPLKSNFREGRIIDNIPSKQKIKEMMLASDKFFKDEVNLKECPFYVQNNTGYNIIFHLIYNEYSDSFYIANTSSVAIPYPYNIHNQIQKYENIKVPRFQYHILLVNSDLSLSEVYSGHKIIQEGYTNIRVQNLNRKGEMSSQVIHMENENNDMRQMVTLSSEAEVCSEIDPKVYVVIGNNKHSFTLDEYERMPIPFDMVDLPITFSIIDEIFEKHGAKVKVHHGKVYHHKRLFKKGYKIRKRRLTGRQIFLGELHDEKIINYKLNNAYAFNIYISKALQGSGKSKALTLVPPLVIKNKILTNVNFFIVRDASGGTTYDEKHKIKLHNNDYEIYEVFEEKLKIRLGLGRLKSQVVVIDLTKVDKVTDEDVWLYQKGKKTININFIGYFERGSYFIEVYMKAMLVDELFMLLKYSQNIGTSEEIIYPINKFNTEDRELDAAEDEFDLDDSRELGSLDEAAEVDRNIRRKEALIEARDLAKNRNYSSIYFIQENEPIHLADTKYIHETTTVRNSRTLQNEDHRIFYYNNDFKTGEYYDIVSTSYYHTFKSPQSYSTKIVQLKPKYILFNDSERVFNVAQANENIPSRYIVLGSDERMPLFTNDKKVKYPRIKFRAKDHEWSDIINLSNPMLIFIALKQKSASTEDPDSAFRVEKYTNFNIQMTLKNDSYILLMRENLELSPFKIVNNLKQCTLYISQDVEKLKNKVAEMKVPYKEMAYYSWPRPFSKPTKLFVMVYIPKLDMYSEPFEILKDLVSHKYEIKVGFKDVKVFHFSKISGVSNKIVITDHINNELFDPNNISKTLLLFPDLGVSVINGVGEKRKELLYVHLKDLEYASRVSKDETVTEVGVGYLNIDNNSDTIPCYPVFMTPKMPLYMIENNNLKHIQLYVNQANSSSKNITTYNQIKGQMMETLIQVDEKLVAEFFEMQGQITKNMDILDQHYKQKYKKYSKPEKIRNQEEDETDYDKRLKMVVKENWKLTEFDEGDQEGFVNNFEISPISLNVSYAKDPDHTDSEYAQFMNSVSFDIVGFFLTNIEGAPITLQGVESRSQACPISLVTNIVKKKYMASVRESLIPVLGSFNLLGNPQQLIAEVSTGVKELFNKPKARMEDAGNPLALGAGIAEGTGSLMKHTARGAFGSIGRATKAFADTFNAAHLDREYDRRRLRIRFQKSNGLIDTLNKSMRQAGFGFKEGFKGLFLKPVEMGQREGAAGALKGTYMGVSGLLMKPLGGILDAASTLTAGVSNATKEEQEKSNDQRIRKPRPFYGPNYKIKPYNSKEAVISEAINSDDPLNRYNQPIQNLVEVYEERMNNHKVFSYSKAKLMCLDHKTKEVDWVITPDTFNGFHIENNKITFKKNEHGREEDLRIFTYNYEDLRLIQDFVKYKFPKFYY